MHESRTSKRSLVIFHSFHFSRLVIKTFLIKSFLFEGNQYDEGSQACMDKNRKSKAVFCVIFFVKLLIRQTQIRKVSRSDFT